MDRNALSSKLKNLTGQFAIKVRNLKLKNALRSIYQMIQEISDTVELP